MDTRNKIFISIFFSSSAFIILFSIFFILQTRQNTIDNIDYQNRIVTHLTHDVIKTAYSDDDRIDELEFQIIRNILSSLKVEEDGYIYIINEDDIVILHPTEEGRFVGEESYIQEMRAGPEEGLIEYEIGFGPYSNRPKRVHFRIVEELSWIVAAGPFLDEIHAPTWCSVVIIFISVVLLFVLAFFIAKNASKSIYTPVQQSIENIEKMVENSSVKLQVQNEIIKITGSKKEIVNHTIDAIRSATKKIDSK